MHYLWTLDAHELYGPFSTADRAHEYAKEHGLSSYELLDKDSVEQFMYESMRTPQALR